MKRPLRRLYWRIWLAVLASLALFAALSFGAWKLFGEQAYGPQPSALAIIAAAELPPADAAPELQRQALDLWKARFRAELALYAADGTLIAATSPAMHTEVAPAGGPALRPPGPPPAASMPPHAVPDSEGRMVPPLRGRPRMVLPLPDGRTLVTFGRGHGPRPPPFGLIGPLILIAIAVGIGTYPVVRRLTRRLERLQGSVERLGRGELSERVAVEGNDEVARLAESFNAAAGHIEALVGANKALLANASHELRSPLARLRMGLEMLGGDADPKLKAELARDIAELDQLIDEILLMSRLDSAHSAAPDEFAEFDLTALAAEEAARLSGTVEGPALSLHGDARLLRRLLRNLLENAQRYGESAPEVSLRAHNGSIEIRVCDRGPGVPESERERIFEPFYRATGASERHGGVGLGLALVRQIAQRHNGTVRCLPRDGGGSCFLVRLPAASS